MQTRRGRRGAWKCRVSKYRVLFLFIGWRDAKLLSTYSLSSSSSSFYRITRYFLSFFFFFPRWPTLCVQRNRRRYSKEYALLYKYEKSFLYSSFAAIPSKNVCTNICRGKEILFRRCVVVYTRNNVQSWYAAVPFKVVSRKTQDCRNIKHGFCL